MNNYKNTLNLPQTHFPMKADLPQREPAVLQKWQEMHLYEKLREADQGKEKFILHLGPPYANGHIHLGTATTTILKDIIVKSKSFSGFDSPLVPGWDCHGLPIEHNVEKKIGKPGTKVTAAEFRKACREFATTYIDIQRKEFQRLGIIADWEHPYLTMDFGYEANIIRSLSKIIRNGHVQSGYKPVHWCLDCASALAEAEVEYADKDSPSVDVKFQVVNIDELWKRFSKPPAKPTTFVSIPIWTTTPWTLPANEAVALNAFLEYVLIATDHEQFIIAEDLLPAVSERYQLENYRILERVRGEQLSGLKLKHPFYPKEVPVILGGHVTVESGTGAVHIAPAHGQEDFILGQKFHLPLENPVGDNGCFTAATPLLAGLHVNKANEKIIAILKEKGSLIHEGIIRHSYPHCWRHKTPLIFRATPQWFISMDKNNLRQKTLQAIDRVDWIPDWGEGRIRGMIENRPDWCISRQRTWGVPLALFVEKETGELHPDTILLMEKVAKKVEKEGVEAWFTLDEELLLGKDAEHYRKTKDVLDVWFDAGVSHQCVLKVRKELKFPADIVLEGSDQHRGWFQSSLLTAIAIEDRESFKSVLTHGFVVDAEGRKMSKSLGNVIAPNEVVQKLGADILRLWVASVDYRYEIGASNEILTRMSETYRRIRNTARFFLANLNDFSPEKNSIPQSELLALDAWAIDKAYEIQEEIINAYKTYQFHIIIQKLHNFCVLDMGGFYLDIIKDRLYTTKQNSLARRSCQTALHHIVNALVRWIAPVLSFTAEEIWTYMPGKKSESIFFEDWYEQLTKLSGNEPLSQTDWEKIRAVRDAVNKEIENQRNAGQLGSSLEAEVSLYCGANLRHLLEKLENELRFVLITSQVQVIAEHAGPLDALATDVPGLALKIKRSEQPKCIRCWHRLADVGKNPDYPELCARCIENVAADGEDRSFA